MKAFLIKCIRTLISLSKLLHSKFVESHDAQSHKTCDNNDNLRSSLKNNNSRKGDRK